MLATNDRIFQKLYTNYIYINLQRKPHHVAWFDIDVCKLKGISVFKLMCLLSFDAYTGHTFLLEEPEDHGMGIETHAGLGSANFWTTAKGIRDSEEASDRRLCRSTRAGSRTQNELAKAKEDPEYCPSSWSCVRAHGVLSEFMECCQLSELCQSSLSVAIAKGVWSELMRCSCNSHEYLSFTKITWT